MNIIICFLCYNLLYTILEFYYKKYNTEELCRKIAHIGTGLITFTSLNYLVLTDYFILLIIFVIQSIFIRKYNLVSFITSNKRGYGDIYFILGQGILISFMNYNIIYTQIGLLILTLSDGLAPFGKNLCNKKIFGEKTIGGSFIFFISTLLILLVFLPLSPKLICIAFLLTIVELLSLKGTDNIFIPIFTLLIFYYLG